MNDTLIGIWFLLVVFIIFSNGIVYRQLKKQSHDQAFTQSQVNRD